MNISTRRSFQKSLTGAAAVLAAALGLSLAGPHRADAAPRPLAAPSASDLGVSILSPDPHVPLAGLKPVEISAFYQGSPQNQIIAIELFIDGAKAATKTLDAPETRGVVSFLVDAGQITAGTHQIVVRATAADQEVQSTKSEFTFSGMGGTAEALSGANPGGPDLSLPNNPALSSGLPPTLRLLSPSADGRVQGTITLKVEASDPSGKAPYVSLFIDKTFKTLRNYAPYEFEWDTTAYSNGYHTVEAYGYNDSPHVGQAKALRLYVNNPGGETQIRHDLLDAAPVVKLLPPAPAPKKRAARPLALRRPATALPNAASALPNAASALPDARMASLVPAHTHSTAEIVRLLESGAGSLHFGSLDFAAELSSPFAAEKHQPTPRRSVKPAPTRAAKMLAVRPLAAKTPAVAESRPKNIEPGLLAAMPAPAHFAKTAPQIASIRLPEDDLASPFVAAPHVAVSHVAVSHVAVSHVAPVSAPTVKIASYLAELPHGLRTPVKMHALSVHLPRGMNALLRSVGQKTLLFNHTTVTMDRPLTEQNRVLFGPLRQVFEQGGGTLTWQPRTGTVHAKSATKDILLTLGDKQARVNAKQVTLDGKPYLLLGRTMVPLSFIAVALDATVQFDAVSGHLLVTSRQ